MVRAFRDTWSLGVHSYLTYLHDRLRVARELLSDSGSLFLQIGDRNLHTVRALLDDVFGRDNCVAVITLKKTHHQESNLLPSVADYLLWYARDKKQVKYRDVRPVRDLEGIDYSKYSQVEQPNGSLRPLTSEERVDPSRIPETCRVLRTDITLTQDGESKQGQVVWSVFGTEYRPGRGRHWRTGEDGRRRLLIAGRVSAGAERPFYRAYWDDTPSAPYNNIWGDMAGAQHKVFVVQTNSRAIERCVLMATDPGDLVVDPTCGSGTTAWAAEKWGRRWITVDTSRVAATVARQRLLTAVFELFKTKGVVSDGPMNPSHGFLYKQVPYVTLGSIARNEQLDEIAQKYSAHLESTLEAATLALKDVGPSVRSLLQSEYERQVRERGRRGVTDAERRKLLLPTVAFSHSTVPFDAAELWPPELSRAVLEYRALWREMRIEIEGSISQGADRVDLVDQPSVVSSAIRVCGPFTVEGVQPEGLSLGEDGLFDGSPNEFEHDAVEGESTLQQKNRRAFLEQMIQLLRQDGLSFLNNQRRAFAAVEPLLENGTGGLLHAEGAWDDSITRDVLDVAIGFGPQYGPVTALQVEGLIRSTKRHKDLVIAGFSFDADATAMIQEQSHPKLRIHQAYIRPDVNPGMDGLLKDTPNSQLFTVFGTPEIELAKTKDGEHVVELKGVDIYDPVANTVRSTGADKVAAWFLDSDFDGRCFCVTQAFFPDQDAWEKIAKALGSAADADAFEAFKGTTSIPFASGTHKRIAVKVIDPRGNEVMVVRALEA